MVIQGDAPVWGIRRFEGEGDQMRTPEEGVVKGADPAALMEEGWAKRELKSVREMSKRDGVGPMNQRTVRAFLLLPASVEITDEDAGGLRTPHMTKDGVREIRV